MFAPPLEKCVEHRSKLLNIVYKNWAPPRKLFAVPGVPSWCVTHKIRWFTFIK